MSLAGIPRDRILAALALPENAAASDALRRALSASGHSATSEPVNVQQRASSAADGVRAKKGKRRGEMNQTESRFAREVLDAWVAAGRIVRYEYEAVTFRVPNVGACTPDFCGWDEAGRPLLFEVKGWKIHEASVLRMKAHAAARPWLRWLIFARRNGSWEVYFDSRV